MSQSITDYQVPATEFDEVFVDGMRRRMAVSYHKYGAVADGAGKVDWIDSLHQRLDRYAETGNTEWLIDVANFAMIEQMFPQHPEHHYRATDSDESPGRVHATEAVIPGSKTKIVSARQNLDVRGKLTPA